MFIKIEGNKSIYPYNISTIFTEYPNTSFPSNIFTNYELLKELNIYTVYPADKPDFDYKMEKLVEGQPVYSDNLWYQTWIKQSLMPKEIQERIDIKLQEIRALRNRLLFESDWTQLPDISPTISEKWSNYRQQLRNITNQPNAPFEIIWPQQP